MVRFSCFSTHIPSQKPKKAGQSSAEAMQIGLQDLPQNQVTNTTGSVAFQQKAVNDCQISDHSKSFSSYSTSEHGCKSEEIMGKLDMQNNSRMSHLGSLKKSQSLGSGLCWEGKMLKDNDAEDGIDLGSSSGSHDQNVPAVIYDSKDAAAGPPSEDQKDIPSESVQVGSDNFINEIFSVGGAQNSEKDGNENSDTPESGNGECIDYYADHMLLTPPKVVKSSSLPNISASVSPSREHSPIKHMVPRSRSADDLQVLDTRHIESSIHGVDTQVSLQQGRDDICRTEKHDFENPVENYYDSANYYAVAKSWIIPDEVNSMKDLDGESAVQQVDDLPNKDFKIKRIEDWVNDLQHCSSLEESEQINHANDNQVNRDINISNGMVAAKVDDKVTPAMEAAKRYISSLSASSSTAQLSNHGLVVIPFLSAFSSLKVLNLLGNAIVRITAGALPRGLHMLNLSKNKISTIEGLRELTRLRVLDLSYNRIVKIGHGLASCSSLKELYLAGNKISEVEGLHRLLKLTVLDLRFNKISTAKGLGQLAANYNSLQAISLEGNPAQKNVGDEQLKKNLQGLLPHLVYFNRQPIKANTVKDASDRAVRLGVSAHQFDRGLRSENKGTRKSGLSLAAHKVSSSSTHGRKSQPQSKGRHGRLPPAGTKATSSHRRHDDFASKILQLKSEFSSIRRSRSEGTLGAF